MTTDDLGLSAEQRELVAIGASIGACCHPCVDYHLKAGKKAELTGDRLRTAVRSAELVASQAAEQLSLHVSRQLGDEDKTPATAAASDTELASLGAAIGANDVVNIERHMKAAVALGISTPQLEQAIEMAHTVQTNAIEIHLRAARRLLEEAAPPTVTATDNLPNKAQRS